MGFGIAQHRRLGRHLVARFVGFSNFLFFLCALVLAGSLFLGGGTRAGFLSDAVLQFLAIPLLLFALWHVFETPLTKQARWALYFCLTIFLLPILQLIPLPPAIWTALPNRGPSAESFALTGHQFPWLPISVSPNATWLSALALLPPIAVFVGTLLLSYRERRLLSLTVLAVGIVSVFVGLMQLAQGPASSLRFFEFTNAADAVGFFANRNHFAALLYCLMLFAAAWAADIAITTGITAGRKTFDTTSIVVIVGCFTVLVVLVAAQAMARSRAGLGLTIIALFGALVLAFTGSRGTSGVTPAKLLLAGIVLAVTFAAQFALYRILERFAVDPLADSRIRFVRNTIEAAKAYMPFGSGAGTFVPVYSMFEKPQDAMINVYANHAHNDIAELWLETGVVGLALLGVFAIWLTLRSADIWRRTLAGESQQIDWYLARAATVVIALLIAHSFVDYPMRTGAVMAIMAFACALLINPPIGAERADAVTLLDLQKISDRFGALGPGAPNTATSFSPSIPTSRPLKDGSNALTPYAAQTKAADMEWPEAWRNPSRGSLPNRPISTKSSGDDRPERNED